MAREIPTNDFPELFYLLEGYLRVYGGLEDAVHDYFVVNGSEKAEIIIREIEKLLTMDYSETEVTDFVLAHSIYLRDEGGKATLKFIKDALVKLTQRG